ncbi:MAG: TonB-dependent receptor [Flavobacteriales bacterium]|nr:TonB-dependent receptor [Flavobacteriales bacterium]
MKTQNPKRTKNLVLQLLTIAAIYCFTFQLNAQELTQSIRGRVIDADSEMPAVGATVVVLGSNPFIGAATDIDGYYKLENVPLGRVNIEVSYLGYEKQTISNVVVTSAKEVMLHVGLMESIKELEGFEVVGNARHDEPINEMAIISSRVLSTEEAGRYAGTFNDPARMASNFAGVSSNAEGNNDIVVRGNSPKGILWRLEGIEIPNPNHFADEGATGGPINALNSKMLANSEFLTGAFAPEYGNATSGVFDMKLRQGNNEKREYSLGVGVMGTDITAEGPFKQGGKASYLANYRYSSLALLSNAGIVDFGGVPEYQDGSFKIFLPTKKAGIFNVFGMGGISHILGEESDTNDENLIRYRSDYGAQMGVAGVGHTFIINDGTYIKSSLSVSNNGSTVENEELSATGDYLTMGTANMNKNTVKMASTFNKKLDARNKMSLGIIHTELMYSFKLEERSITGALETPLNDRESSSFTQAHVTWKHRFNDRLTVVSGLHFLQFNLNNTYSVEPRVGMSYKVTPNQTITAGFGIHSKMESLLYYTANVSDSLGNISQPNLDLELPKAAHYVLGYDYQFAANTHVKAEMYFQQLFDVGVENNINSQYSLINQSDWFDNVELVSEGKGRNYGVELTLERFFANRFYYLVTGSLYQSSYQNLDGVWRDSRFNGNYNANFLIGKEFKVGKIDKRNTLQVNIKSSLQGGNRYTPVDLNQSILAGETVRIKDSFSAKAADVFYINLSGSYLMNREKTTHEFKLEILNVTNNQAHTSEYYNSDTQKIEYNTQLGLIPNVMYTLHF